MKNEGIVFGLLLGAVVVIVVGLGAVNALARNDAKLAVAQQETRAAKIALDSAFDRATALEAQAISLRKLADMRTNAGKGAAVRATRRVTDTLVVGDSLALVEAIAMAEDWHEAYEEEKAASGLLRQSNDSLHAALAEIKPAAARLSDVSVKLVEASRPNLFARLLPGVGLGVAAGIDPSTQRPAIVVGITLGWSR